MDIKDEYLSFITILNLNANHFAYAGPGHWVTFLV